MVGFGDYMVKRWTAQNADERLSLRALGREFNIRLLKDRLERRGEERIEGTEERYYEALTDDAVSSGVRTQVKRQLEQTGINVDELRSEFVSRQAVHTYLTKTRDVSQSNLSRSVNGASIRETIDRLQERLRQVSASKLAQLHRNGEIQLGQFRVIVDVQVYCSECGVQQSVSELLGAGGCGCGD